MQITKDDYAIYNEMEELVDQALKQLLSEDPSACNCPICLEDMSCLVLNQMHAMYKPVTDGSKINKESIRLDHLQPGLFNQIMVESYKALSRVKEEPRHDLEHNERHNSNECLIRFALRDILREQDRILDRDERSQVMAKALNNFKPHYNTTKKGHVFGRAGEVDPSCQAKIYASIFNALKSI